jgi:GxxExxY protein
MDINELTYKINGAIFEVNRILGPGFLEKVYEKALVIELRGRGLKVENQVPIKVRYIFFLCRVGRGKCLCPSVCVCG